MKALTPRFRVRITNGFLPLITGPKSFVDAADAAAHLVMFQPVILVDTAELRATWRSATPQRITLPSLCVQHPLVAVEVVAFQPSPLQTAANAISLKDAKKVIGVAPSFTFLDDPQPADTATRRRTLLYVWAMFWLCFATFKHWLLRTPSAPTP